MTDPSYAIRAFEAEEDVARLARLLAEVEAVDHDGEDVSEETLRGQLTLPGHDAARDRWVAVAPEDCETLLGWGFVWLVPGETMATLAGATHPKWRGRGIGMALLERALERGRALGAASVGAYAGGGNEHADAFLRRRGFAEVSANTLLRIGGDTTLPDAGLPTGYTPRTYADDPDPALFQRAVNHCFEGQWGHHTVTEEFVAGWLPTLDLEGIFLAMAPDGDVAGMVLAERYGEPVGYIDAPGVAPEHRGAGLYVPLALAALRRLRERGAAAVEMESWGDAPETLAAYESLGFQVARRAVAYERAT